MDSIEKLQRSRWTREEKGVRNSLEKLAEVSPAYKTKILFKVRCLIHDYRY